MFFELMPMLKERTVLITVALIDGKLKVNVIPTKAKDSEDHALTTPLSYTGSPEELDAELGKHLASYVDSHVHSGAPWPKQRRKWMRRRRPLVKERRQLNRHRRLTRPRPSRTLQPPRRPQQKQRPVYSVRNSKLENHQHRRAANEKGVMLRHD